MLSKARQNYSKFEIQNRPPVSRKGGKPISEKGWACLIPSGYLQKGSLLAPTSIQQEVCVCGCGGGEGVGEGGARFSGG